MCTYSSIYIYLTCVGIVTTFFIKITLSTPTYLQKIWNNNAIDIHQLAVYLHKVTYCPWKLLEVVLSTKYPKYKVAVFCIRALVFLMILRIIAIINSSKHLALFALQMAGWAKVPLQCLYWKTPSYRMPFFVLCVPVSDLELELEEPFIDGQKRAGIVFGGVKSCRRIDKYIHAHHIRNQRKPITAKS